MKTVFTLTLALLLSGLHAQKGTVDFESAGLVLDTFLNRAPDNNAFRFDPTLQFHNEFDTSFNSWTGWAISTMRDSTTEGFTNQYSSITGGGANGSDTYMVSYQFAPDQVGVSDCCYILGGIDYLSVDVTNATYPYLSMKNGDAFAKKFGGASGDDPDYLLLTIKGYNENQGEEGLFVGEAFDSIEVYLADFRFEDNSLDYILDEWLTVDLQPIKNAGTITFNLSSSDVGMFGVNTPTYFCLDNLEYGLLTSTTEVVSDIAELYPNPATESLFINLEVPATAPLTVLNTAGQLVQQLPPAQQYELDVEGWPTGIYSVVATTSNGVSTQRVVVRGR